MERIGCGAILLDTSGEVLDSNYAAQRIIELELGADCAARGAGGRSALKHLLSRADARFRMEGESWVVISRPDSRQLVLHAIVIGHQVGPGPHTLLVLIDLNELPNVDSTALRKIFGLTAAEARLTLQICQGETPAEIAEANGVALPTVRTQLASVFTKTHTRRQAELVALVARIAILP